MKTPEEMARDWSRERTMQPCPNGYNMWIMDEWRLAEEAFLAGYQAARDEYEAKIKELETELDNWQHAATHGDEGL